MMSFKNQYPERIVTETSNLLKKSLSNSSLTHEDIQQDLEEQLHNIRKTAGKSILAYRLKLLLPYLWSCCALFIVTSAVSLSLWRNERAKAEIRTDIEHQVELEKLAKINEIPSVHSNSPFSLLDPVRHLKVAEHGRTRDDPSFPSYYYGTQDAPIDRSFRALPTNAWYQNLLQAPQHGEPSNLQRIYPGPYLLDVVGTIPGLRVHATDIVSTDMVMQLTFNEHFSLVLGAAKNTELANDKTSTNRYNVLQTTELGVTLEWEATKMKSNIVKGMSFVSMEYDKSNTGNRDALLPTIASASRLEDNVLVDGKKMVLDCDKDIRVEKDIELYFPESDYSWMAFFSEPVDIRCSLENGKSMIQVVGYNEEASSGSCSSPSKTLMIRLALVDQCTKDSTTCRLGLFRALPDEPEREEYVSLLRAHVDVYPGSNTSFSYVMPEEEGDDKASLIFDWDAKRMTDLCQRNNSTFEPDPNVDMLVFAIPHQMDRLPPSSLPNNKRYCKVSLTGPACLAAGNRWVINQQLPEINFWAKRPPRPEFIPTLGELLSTDINFKIPDYYQRGAGDTYFSGKILAKLARIILIAEEVDNICGKRGDRGYVEICDNTTLPDLEEMETAIRQLRDGVEVWINGKAETPLVYDTSWGGVVSCGCYMEGERCVNRYPDCPGFSDPGLNFGNGFYNDHHFHYGYHIFAAAVVAHYDPVWGMNNFENVLLLVRDIANPSEEDNYFPLFRHKDWYQGSSWASGIAYPAYLNGKNQESSSEAIAAYEGVALFGQVMSEIWENADNERYAATAKEIGNIGRLLAGTELVSAKRYWQIPEDTDNQPRIYPEQYNQHVVGILWQTMAQFGTWFGTAPYLPIGIQLLPLTPISEDRDDISWINSIYEPFTYSCATSFECTESGWSILQLAVLATIGYAPEAALKMKELPDEAFENAGGNGHSRSNTLWYIATRPSIENPIPMVRYDKRGKEEVRPKALYELRDCYRPDSCTDDVLDRYAGSYTCRDRISWMIQVQGLPQWEACSRIAGLEFPNVCGPCTPDTVPITSSKEDDSNTETGLQCPPCSETECNSDFNRCPIYEKTFVCTKGTNKGGCTGDSQLWLKEDECSACCEMTECVGLKDHEAEKFTMDGNALTKSTCPPCKPEVCYGKLNLCPIHSAPYLCTKGLSIGGCSSTPWHYSKTICSECCEITPNC